MKQIERKIVTTFRWWRDDGKDVLDEHLEQLDEDAIGRIRSQVSDGCTSGELNSCFNPDPEVIEYSGWWKMTTTTT